MACKAFADQPSPNLIILKVLDSGYSMINLTSQWNIILKNGKQIIWYILKWWPHDNLEKKQINLGQYQKSILQICTYRDTYSIKNSWAQSFKVTLFKQFKTANAAFSLQNLFWQQQSFKYKITRRSETSFL